MPISRRPTPAAACAPRPGLKRSKRLHRSRRGHARTA